MPKNQIRKDTSMITEKEITELILDYIENIIESKIKQIQELSEECRSKIKIMNYFSEYRDRLKNVYMMKSKNC